MNMCSKLSMIFAWTSFFSGISAYASAAVPSPVNGGNAGECDWPTVVAVVDETSTCTGTLIHPEIVVFGADCSPGEKSIVWGENVQAPQKEQTAASCYFYGSESSFGSWGFCHLASPILQLPITPLIYGCEQAALEFEREVRVVGFSELGTKRWTQRKIIGVGNNGVVSVGGNGLESICSQEPKGPMFVQFADGSFHVAGIFSMQLNKEENCSLANAYIEASQIAVAIEERSGMDVTPCHRRDGHWDPTSECGGFFASDSKPQNDWQLWCSEQTAVASSRSCGAPYNAPLDETPPSVSITSPQSSVYEDESRLFVTVDVAADDGEGWGIRQVRIKINDEFHPEVDTWPPYRFTGVRLDKQGQWKITAQVEDFAGHVVESKPVEIFLGTMEEEPTSSQEPNYPNDVDSLQEVGCRLSSKPSESMWFVLCCVFGWSRLRRASKQALTV